jgi:hypothetical protein
VAQGRGVRRAQHDGYRVPLASLGLVTGKARYETVPCQPELETGERAEWLACELRCSDHRNAVRETGYQSLPRQRWLVTVLEVSCRGCQVGAECCRY